MAVVTLPIPEHAAFTRDDEQSIQKNIHQARTILRTVALAAEAQDDGAVLYGDNGAGRWGPAIDQAIHKVTEVRDVLINQAGGLAADWYTPLAMLEALGAALWHSNVLRRRGTALDCDELETAAGAVIECLDELSEACAAGAR